MPTKNPRINITVEEPTAKLIAQLAKKQHKTVASFTKELVEKALESMEDMALSAIAESRNIDEATLLEHEDVWK
ncbi:MAG: hypothetical protein WD449_00450 [Candidatus Babeliales bacterium]